MIRSSAAYAAALWAIALAASAATPAPSPAERGKAVFAAKGCYQCHGLIGQGSVSTAPAIAPVRFPPAAFKAYVRHPGGVMPGYGPAILPDSDLDDVLAYLQSLPPGRPAASIPLLAPYVVGAATSR